MAERYVFQDAFEEHKKAMDQRFNDQSKRIDGIHHGPGGLHDLRNLVASVPLLSRQVQEIVSDMKNVPSRAEIQKDLNSQTETINLRFNALADERKSADKRITWFLTGIGIFLTVVMIALKLFGKG